MGITEEHRANSISPLSYITFSSYSLSPESSWGDKGCDSLTPEVKHRGNETRPGWKQRQQKVRVSDALMVLPSIHHPICSSQQPEEKVSRHHAHPLYGLESNRQSAVGTVWALRLAAEASTRLLGIAQNSAVFCSSFRDHPVVSHTSPVIHHCPENKILAPPQTHHSFIHR